MSFTHSAFIRKNTPELREILINLGLKIGLYRGSAPIISACYGEINATFNKEPYPNDIDCGENEDLFLALAALRDDSDYGQWFVWNSPQDSGEKWKKYDENPNWNWWKYEAHKATVLEIIEHFKTER